MKKAPIVVLSAAVVAAIVVVPPMFIKSTVQEQVEAWQEKVGHFPGYSLIVKQEQDGWFSSSYIGQLSYDLKAVNPELEELIGTEDGMLIVPFQLTTAYGPLLFADSLSVGTAKATVKVDEADVPEAIHWDRKEPFYQLDVVRGLTGNYSHEDHIVAFEFKPDDSNESIQFDGYKGHGSYVDNILAHDAQIDRVSVSGEVPLVMEGFTQNINVKASLADIFNGALFDYTMAVGIKQVTAGDVFSIKDVEATGENLLDEKAGLANSTMTLSADTLEQADFGTITGLKLVMEANNFSSEFLRRYNQMTMGGFLEADLEQQQTLLLDFLVDNLALLLAPKPEFNITEFSAQLVDTGKFEFGAHSRIDAGDNPDVDVLTSNPYAWLPLIQADAALEVDQPLVDKIASYFLAEQLKPMLEQGQMTQEEYDTTMEQAKQQMISGLMAQGLLEKRDDTYVSNFLMEDGKATLNGQPIPM